MYLRCESQRFGFDTVNFCGFKTLGLLRIFSAGKGMNGYKQHFLTTLYPVTLKKTNKKRILSVALSIKQPIYSKNTHDLVNLWVLS